MILQEIENGTRAVITKKTNEKGKIEFVLDQHAKEEIVSQFAGESSIIEASEFAWYDKTKWVSATSDERTVNFRMCPGTWIRKGAYIGEKVIFMPCFINIGAYVGDQTMIDSGVTIGSCAYIGKNCHISSNTVVAGVLEPVQASPCIIDDNCFIGAQCLFAEGVVVETGCVIAAGTRITQSTRIYDRETGEYSFGRVPANSVVVPGSYDSGDGLSIACAIIVKKTTPEIRKKTSLRELLRT